MAEEYAKSIEFGDDMPLDLDTFAWAEGENFRFSKLRRARELHIANRVANLYREALRKNKSAPNINENDQTLSQIFHFIYFHFLFSISCMMRCYPSEAFASARAAIDGALIAILLIDDPALQTAYRQRQRPLIK